MSGEYQYEQIEADPNAPREDVVELKTNRFPMGNNFFYPIGFNTGLKASYIDQTGKFGTGAVEGDDQFWVVDLYAGYRLPKRYGVISFEARNLFDEKFRFQDTDPGNPSIYPERMILAKFSLSF